MLHGVEHGVSMANHAPTKMLQPVEELTCSRPGFTGQFCEFRMLFFAVDAFLKLQAILRNSIKTGILFSAICQFTNSFLPPAPNPYVEVQ